CSTNHGIPLEFSSAFSMVHRLHTKCRLTPACNDAAAVAAGRALHSTASRSSETVPPPAASEGAPHRACPSSAAVRSWHESGPHRPTHNSQLRQQIHQPVTVAGGFHADQRRRRYLPVEPFRVARGLDQLLLSGLSRLRVQPTHLLPAGVKITSHNH